MLPRTFTTIANLFFSTQPAKMTRSANAFLDAVKHRRSHYALEAKSPVPDSRIVEIIQETVKHVPSRYRSPSPSPPFAATRTHARPRSYNSQTARAIVLLGEEHRKLWDITTECLRAIVPAEAFTATEKKLHGFKSAYGTVLWFEDQTGVKAMQDAFPSYANKFPIFSEHASGMNQYVAWTALEAEGFGANLQVGSFPSSVRPMTRPLTAAQHYSPIIDDKVRAEWNVPESWMLESQLVFGLPLTAPGEKTFKPIEDRVKVYGA